MNTTYPADPLMLDLGLLVARLVIGLLMAAHGTQKLLGWFGGYGLNTTGEFFVQLGFQRGRAFATLASVAEVTSGLLAAISVHWKNGVFATQNGIEVPLLYATGAFGLAMTGFGDYALDALLGIRAAWTPAITWAVLTVGIVGGLGNLVLRHPAKARV